MIIDVLKKIKYILLNGYTWVYGLFHPIEKKILFMSFSGKQYSDNPRAISEKMHLLFPEFNLVWAFVDFDNKYGLRPEYIRHTKMFTMDFYRELATSFCVVSNEDYGLNIHKKKKQFFIQTWHGDRVPKKVLYDACPSGKGMPPVMDSKVTDLCIAGSACGKQVYRTAFRYKGEILNIGMPRNDKLINISEKEIWDIKNRIGLDKDSRILLYAPTFRDNNIKNKQNINVNLEEVIKELSKDGTKWICLIRAHSASKGLVYEYNNTFINVTDYPDMADLLAIADMLITDYSSSAGDFIVKNKPAILACFDVMEYNKNCREFAFLPDEVGFQVAYSQHELIDKIRKITPEETQKINMNIIKTLEIVESGESSREICSRIVSEYSIRQKQK